MDVTVQPEDAHREVRIAAAGFVRGASDIVPAVIAHLIGQGITDFYLTMHNEEPDVSQALVEALGARANFTIFHHEHPVFNQPALSQMMMTQARREGFDIYLPFDADEFYVATNPQSTVAEELSRWYRCDTTEQLLVPNRNFLAPYELDDFTTRDLARLTHRIEYKPHVPYSEMQRRLEPMLKSVARLTGIDEADFVSTITGNHRTFRGRELLSHEPPRVPNNFDVVILHVPYRSRNTTLNPANLRRAIDATNRSRDDYNKEEFTALFDEMWIATSLSFDEQSAAQVDRGDYRLFVDDSCARVLDGLALAGFDINDPWCRPVHVPHDAVFSSRIYVNEPFFDIAVTAITAHVRRATEEWEALEEAKRNAQAFRRDAKGRISRIREANARLRSRNQRLVNKLATTPEKVVAEAKPAPSRWHSVRARARRVVGSILRRLGLRK